MKTPTPPPAGGFQLRSRAILLLLLTTGVGLGLWHYRQSGGSPPVASEVTALPAPASVAAVTPQSPAPEAAHAAGGGATVAGQPANVRIAAHPEESPAWAVPYGAEFWRQSTAAAPAPLAGDTNPAAPFNIGEVVARVSHAFRPGDAGALPEVKAQTYTARFDADAGLGFSPHRPAASPEVMDNAGAKEPPDRHSRRPSKTNPATRPQADPETEAWFRTLSVARDGQPLFTAGQDTPQWSLLGNTAQGLLNETAGLVTHYEARANGVEVTWVLPQAPAGAGPLMVEAELSGLNYAGATEQGLHYADAAGVARVRVGPVTVVDAAGARWDLAMAADGNRLRLEVPADLLAQATYPLAIDPALEAEFEIDKRVVIPAGQYGGFSHVAAGGNGFLVVWQGNGIRGTRVTTAGQVSDPNGIPIRTGATDLYFLTSVAASSNGYLVVWTDYRDYEFGQIFGARVTTSGVLSDTNGIRISPEFTNGQKPAVAAGSNSYLVVWQGDGIRGARVTMDGVVSDPAGFLISTRLDNTPHSPSVASSSNGYLVVWKDSFSGIYGARVTTAGEVTDSNRISIATTAGRSGSTSVAAGSNGYLVVWEDSRNGNHDVYGARVTVDGVVSDPSGIPISITSAADDQIFPSVAASSSGYLVVWTDIRNGSHGIFGARVTTDGLVSDPTGFPISTNASGPRYPSVAAGSNGFLVVWEGNGIRGTRVTKSGVVSDPAGFPISVAANNIEYHLSVAASSRGYLVVWEDRRNGIYDIYGARVTTSGVVSDPAGLPISTNSSYQFSPAVAAGNNSYLVVWQDERNGNSDIYGTRVTVAGVVSDPAGIPISTAANEQVSPSVAASSTSYLVGWGDNRSGNSDIYGARVATSGEVSDTNGIPITTAVGEQYHPSVAASGSGCLVVWQDGRSGSSFDIYGSRVTTNGVVSDPAGLLISTATNEQSSPSVAASSSGYLVVWEDYRNGSSWDIYGARVSTGGVVGDPTSIPICTLAGDQYSPSVAATSTGYVVVWQDYNSQSQFWHRVDPAGEVVGDSALAINGSYGRSGAALAYGGAGRFLLTSSGFRKGAQRIIGSLHSTNRPAAGPVLEFKSSDFRVMENESSAIIFVTLSGNNPGTVAVDYATTDGTAQDGDDYQSQYGTLVFPKGTTQQYVFIRNLNDTLPEADEAVNLVLSNPSGGATLGLKHRATLTIKDDDVIGALTLSAATYSVKESTHSLEIRVTRVGGTASDVTVAYATGGGTAVAGIDYDATSGILSYDGSREWFANTYYRTFSIPIHDNLIKEGKKTFFVHLFNPTSGAKLGKIAAATVTILEDD